MNKRKLCIALGSGLVFLSIASGAIASIAWFTVLNGFDVGITGSFVEEWFHTGDGTSANPFVITRPIHYYHLVEFFQRETELPGNQNFGTDYLYFQVGYDLDDDGDLEVFDYDNQGIYTGSADNPSYSNTLNMAYYSGSNALMPIGTNEIPFIGSFDGKASEGIVISNLNICCSETVEIDGNPVTRTASDIGIFGYVADADGNSNPTVIKDSRFNGVTIDLSDVTTTVASSSTGVTHEDSHAGIAYVGYIAGHVHTYTNYQAGATPETSTNATPLHDVYVNNATVQGGAGVNCNFGYIGLVDEMDDHESSAISGIVADLGDGTGGGQGQGDNWGGSINIKALNLRFYNMLNVTTNDGIATDDPSTHHPTEYTNATANTVTTGKTFLSKLSYHYKNSGAKNQHRYYSDDYNKLSVAIYGNGNSSNSKMNNSPLNQTTLYCLEDSRTKTATHYQTSSASSTTNYSTALPGTILPLNVDTKENGYETLHSSEKGYNTGYLIGGQTATSYSYGNVNSNAYYYTTTVRTASSSIQYIGNSINSTTTFSNSKLEVLTNLNKEYDSTKTKAQNFARIEDDYNKTNTSIDPDMAAITSGRETQREILSSSFHSYTGARQSLGNGQNGILDSASFIHGLHFLNGVVSDSAIETADNIYINSTTPLDNYEFPRGSLDFNLKEKGYISFFAGSYQAAKSDCDGFFSLYTVSRTTTESGSTIDDIREIDKIYKNPDNATKTEYPYIYKIRGTSTYTTGNSDIALTSSQISALELLFDCEYIRHDPPLDSAIYYFEIPTNKGEYVIGNADNAGNSNGATAGAYLMYLDIAATAGEQQQPTYNQENMIKNSSLFTQIDFQINSYVINSCFNIAYVIPAGSTKETFSITVSSRIVTPEGGHSYTRYDVTIVNNSGSSFILNALLMDDDDDPDNDYYYRYTIKYNTGSATEYTGSNTFTGSSGGTTMTPTYTSGD